MNRILPILAASLCLSAGAAERQQLTSIPTVYIDTDNSAPITGKEDYVKGTVTVMSDDDSEVCSELSMGIRGRGNSTWGMPKKPYRIKFDSKTNFLNLPAKAKSWVLLANYADKTLMRNAIAFEISEYIGMEYTPSVKFVDVVLNGEYLGNYMVTDQTEVAKKRVPVEEQEETDTEEPAVTGGYLLEIDGFADSEPVWFSTEQGLKVTIKYPKDDEINSAQQAYITDYVRLFESKLFASNFTDAEAGYRSMVDEESLVNWYIACELTANSDAFWSTYIYKKREDAKLYFGPLWDFDIAFNNDNRLGDATHKLMREHAHNPRTWIQRMWKDTWFRTAVNNRWSELVESGIEEHLLATIDAYAEQINASQTMNFDKWKILNNRVYLENYLFPTYQGGVDNLKEFISERIAFLSESFADTDPSTWAVEVNPDSKYLIRHSGGAYLAENGSTCTLANEAQASEVKFVPAADEPGAYGIELPSGSYMGSNKDWDVILFKDFTDSYARFTVEKSGEEGYVHIKNIGRSRCLGTDTNSAGGGIYTDKSGNDPRHLWKLLEIKVSTGLEAVDATLSATLTGNVLQVNVAGCDTRVYSAVTGAEVAAGASTVDVEGLQAGVYIASVITPEGKSLRLKFVKTN